MIEENKDEIIRLKQGGCSWKQIAEHLGYSSGDALRKQISRTTDWYHLVKGILPSDSQEFNKENTQKLLTNGTISSTIKVRLKEQKLFTEDELLKLHGFDPIDFQIKTVTSNEWSMTNGAGEQYYNFQSKIIACKRQVNGLPVEKVGEIVKSITPLPIFVDRTKEKNGYLSIGFFDIHFGLNTLEEYTELLSDLVGIIRKGYKEVLIISGGDFLHVDNMVNTTVRGTNVDQVDFSKMVHDAETFLVTVCKEAYQHSGKVKLVYLPGNHASSTDYMLIRGIQGLIPEIEVDYEIEEYKHTWLGQHSIFLHHGDKRNSSQKLLEVLVGKYAKEWGNSKARYLFTGHYHHEKGLNIAGLTHYQLMSPSKPSSYDKAKGFVTSEVGLQVFEFDEEKRRAIYYL